MLVKDTKETLENCFVFEILDISAVCVLWFDACPKGLFLSSSALCIEQQLKCLYLALITQVLVFVHMPICPCFPWLLLCFPFHLFLSVCPRSWQISERWCRGCWGLTLPAWLFLTMKSSHALKGWSTPISTTSSPVSALEMWQGPQRSSKEASSFFTEQRWMEQSKIFCLLSYLLDLHRKQIPISVPYSRGTT